MDRSTVLDALYNRYIAPTKEKRQKYIGIEIEMPIVNLDVKAVDFSVVHRLAEAFAAKFQMKVVNVDDNGQVVSLQDPHNGDDFSYDCSYNNLELSMGKEQDLNILFDRFKTYYTFIEDFLRPYNHTLTGLGVNPYRKINHCVPIPSERYRMLFHYLGLYKTHTHPTYFHPYPDFGTFASASQVQLDVDYEDLVDTLNTFTKLEPVKALLLSNSVMPEDEPGYLCVRDMFWRNSMHGINPKNIGFFRQEFADVADVFQYIQQTSIYCLMRDGKYINFTPIPCVEYFLSKQVTGEFWNGSAYEKTTFEPQIEDLQYLRTFKLEDLTYRGTVEFRSCCCQPIADSMTVAALHLGLTQTLPELKQLLEKDTVLYGHGLDAEELRDLFCAGKLPDFVDTDALQQLVISVLDLARKGLEERGKQEAHFLEPLYDRARRKSNPALDYLEALSRGVEINTLVRSYADITGQYNIAPGRANV